MSFAKLWISCLLSLFFSTSLLGERMKLLQEGPIHEAFVSQEYGTIALEAVPISPPLDITEQPPSPPDSKMVWIPGYWSWLRDTGDYIWVSGVWRNIPPGRQWIKGEWKLNPAGWVWEQGFWSLVGEDGLTFINAPPPDPLDEKVVSPKGSDNGYFWIPGYWHYEEISGVYIWHAGRWQQLSEQWVLTPAHYIWKDKGYVLVPAFWDWPLEKRGIAFANVFIDPDHRNGIAYTPTGKLDPLYIAEHLYPYWPLYRCFFQHHFHFQKNKWIAWGGSPPWWQWNEWWCYTEFDLWRLWWWWAHPGYPQPGWITEELAAVIAPPPYFIVNSMKKINPPLYVTKNGVVEGRALLEALAKAMGWEAPIFPSDYKLVIEIQSLALPFSSLGLTLLPTGSGEVKALPKVNMGTSAPPMKKPPERVKVPPYPQLMAAVADLALICPICALQDLRSEHGPPFPQETPEYYPPGKYQAPIQRPLNYKLPPQPRYETPYQGTEPDYQYPQIPMQLEHHDEIQSYPQPQRNPLSPRVHPLPQEESTHPNYPPPVLVPSDEY